MRNVTIKQLIAVERILNKCREELEKVGLEIDIRMDNVCCDSFRTEVFIPGYSAEKLVDIMPYGSKIPKREKYDFVDGFVYETYCGFKFSGSDVVFSAFARDELILK